MLTLKAPAKINWFLFVKGKRQDGYHDILSLVQCISLYDSLTLEESAQTDDIEVITDSPIPYRENLVYKAAIALKERASIEKGARITLKKDIPISAGLGGGSSDAAYTLMGLNKLWRLSLNKMEIYELAISLGSDVPFFLDGYCALIEGRGEKVTPTPLQAFHTLLLLKPNIEVSSSSAYSDLGSLELTKPAGNIKLLIQILDTGDFSSLKSVARNDLENPVIRRHPILKEMKERLEESGAVFSAMSGSGPTVFGVFNDPKDAERARNAIPAHWSRVVRTLGV
ncbi:MAG: 4-(cytidine 5'-diphospho)-2-C-methyl-D-erythritol kinase [Nitrospirae bacterium]|nr:4-(cytidine 5'-diphospho)-2-C-methyl-D-erythritol kinase [Nitrospirota bacterium]